MLNATTTVTPTAMPKSGSKHIISESGAAPPNSGGRMTGMPSVSKGLKTASKKMCRNLAPPHPRGPYRSVASAKVGERHCISWVGGDILCILPAIL